MATVCQLVYTNRFQSSNMTATIWPWILCAQIVQTMSIISSCIPYLRPLLEAFPSGMMVNNDITRHATTNRSANGYTKRLEHNYVLRDINKNMDSESGIHSIQELHKSRNSSLPDLAGRGQDFQNTLHIAFAPTEISAGDNQSRHSSQKSESRIIKATTTIETVWR